ncbi:hypothetical protein H257_14170 [Aphanomyces astaci]|uniref:Uncharacterized protein n=1 Tax=Aphanomyces astaci TaxID=112090 RepID=W4FUC8_APHAT|nr:hypothetical protein H257_14170 [Aphanomyces astaci]ETV70268.1 hypothetical protein H257_14170 [Aphanomyces astaci]|eukprot:XP_009840227.1 hypothetical protein H257_14170 [Aphanomyces astaci]
MAASSCWTAALQAFSNFSLSTDVKELLVSMAEHAARQSSLVTSSRWCGMAPPQHQHPRLISKEVMTVIVYDVRKGYSALFHRRQHRPQANAAGCLFGRSEPDPAVVGGVCLVPVEVAWLAALARVLRQTHAIDYNSTGPA